MKTMNTEMIDKVQVGTRLELVAAIYRKVRCEKNPPLARYAMLLALARRGGEPATGHELGIDIGQYSAPRGTIENCLRNGLITEEKGTPPKGTLYSLTPEGVAVVAELMHPAMHDLH
jgi:hypothetical protein